jgi:hypothetical protein
LRSPWRPEFRQLQCLPWTQSCLYESVYWIRGVTLTVSVRLTLTRPLGSDFDERKRVLPPAAATEAGCLGLPAVIDSTPPVSFVTFQNPPPLVRAGGDTCLQPRFAHTNCPGCVRQFYQQRSPDRNQHNLHRLHLDSRRRVGDSGVLVSTERRVAGMRERPVFPLLFPTETRLKR